MRPDPLYKEFQRLMGAGLDISEHLGILRGLACDPDVKTITEFGFRTGVSTTALCTAGKPVISYDIAPCMKHARKLERLAPNFAFVHASSLDVELAKCDLLHIDSLHTHHQLIRELSIHADAVSKWIVLHDTETFAHVGKDGSKPGLMDAITEFFEPRPEWKIHLHLRNNNGLTVMKRSHQS